MFSHGLVESLLSHFEHVYMFCVPCLALLHLLWQLQSVFFLFLNLCPGLLKPFLIS